MMVRRLVLVVALAAALVSVAVWLADRPGEVTIHWQGWRVDTTVPVLVMVLLAVLASLHGVWTLVRAVVFGPRKWLAARRERRRNEGYRALSDGLAAMATGDRRAMGKLAKRADKLLGDPALTGLLTARAAEMGGDAALAERHFRAMLERPETVAVGLKGLMQQALVRGDHHIALDYARRAWAVNPHVDGLAVALFDLQARAGEWAEAELTLADAKRSKLLSGVDVQHRQALVLYQRALGSAGDVAEAAKLAYQAHKMDPTFVPAAVAAAEAFHRLGNERKARAVIEATWKCASHPDLVTATIALAPAETSLMRVKRLERLVSVNSAAPEGRVALAKAALDSRLWGLARTHLEKAVLAQPYAEAYALLARLERDERHNEGDALAWEAKAATAPAAPVWRCEACGNQAEVWSASCPACGVVDGVVWRQQ